MYAKIENGIPVEWPVREFQVRNSVSASLPVSLKADDVVEYGFEPYTESDKPVFNELTQVVEERPPLKQSRIWVQQWAVVERYAPAERDKILADAAAVRNQAPQVVTIRQAKLALLQAGLLDDIDAAVAQAGRAVQIEWEYATEIRRDWLTLTTLQSLIGLSDEQVDDLFKLAVTL